MSLVKDEAAAFHNMLDVAWQVPVVGARKKWSSEVENLMNRGWEMKRFGR